MYIYILQLEYIRQRNTAYFMWISRNFKKDTANNIATKNTNSYKQTNIIIISDKKEERQYVKNS